MREPLDADAAIGALDRPPAVGPGRRSDLRDQRRIRTDGRAHARRGARRSSPPFTRSTCESARRRLEVLASSAPTPLSAVVVGRCRAGRPADPRRRHPTPVDRRRVSARTSTSTTPHRRRSSGRSAVDVAADFAHVFDVKAGLAERAPARRRRRRLAHRVRRRHRRRTRMQGSHRTPDRFDTELGTLLWYLTLIPPRAVGRDGDGRAGRRRRRRRSGVPDRHRRPPTRSRCAGWRRGGVGAARGVDRSAPVAGRRSGVGRHRRAADHRRRPRPIVP